MCAQGQLVNDMRYLASVVTQCFTAFGELLALNKRFAELSGGVTRCARIQNTLIEFPVDHTDTLLYLKVDSTTRFSMWSTV